MMKGLANVGDVLAGKYRVEKILGIGGMGMVVAATHLELDQPVALKFMLPAAMESPEASARFLREARAAGRLTSEHVCRVTDVGRFESGAPYIVMEYLEGYDLGAMLKRRGPLRVAAAVDYLLQACEGLAEAHAQDIVHRDLKPDNLYLAARADGGHVIKVLDFGISKATVTGIATRTGDILGSPAYMAPEQMRSTKDVDVRADLWSLGVVLYQLLTGRLPFGGDSLPTLCLAVLNDDPVPPDQVREDLPAGLSAVILKCLAKEREERYADVGEFAEALASFATPRGAASVPRVRSALRGRQAPPDPSETIPHGFVAPTLLSTGSDLFMRQPAERPSGEPPIGVITGTGSGESITRLPVGIELTPPAPTPRFPLGLVGALSGGIGVVVVLIVMVLRSGDRDVAADAVPPPKAAAPGPKEEPKVTPIEEPKVAPVKVAPVIVEPVAVEPEPTPEPAAKGSAAKSEPVHHKDKVRRTKRQKDSQASTPDPDRDPTEKTPPTEPEDKWGRMQHDQPGSKDQ